MASHHGAGKLEGKRRVRRTGATCPTHVRNSMPRIKREIFEQFPQIKSPLGVAVGPSDRDWSGVPERGTLPASSCTHKRIPFIFLFFFVFLPFPRGFPTFRERARRPLTSEKELPDKSERRSLNNRFNSSRSCWQHPARTITGALYCFRSFFFLSVSFLWNRVFGTGSLV